MSDSKKIGTVYTLFGRKVAEISSKKHAGGSIYNINKNGFAKGVYIFHLELNNKAISLPMMF
jgi:hypothetical protein